MIKSIGVDITKSFVVMRMTVAVLKGLKKIDYT